MKNFKVFVEKLVKLKKNSSVIVRNKTRKIKALAHLTSLNYLEDCGDYYKALFTDGSFLLAIPGEKEIYFADEIVEHVKEIKDKEIGVKKNLIYKGKKYSLDNPHDYQLVLELIIGSPLEIEGECSFSDYVSSEGNKEMLSLGWLSRTGVRADIWCELIDLGEIDIG